MVFIAFGHLISGSDRRIPDSIVYQIVSSDDTSLFKNVPLAGTTDIFLSRPVLNAK